MLLVGLGTRLSLFVQGLIYIALTVGLILIKQDDGISWLGIHVALVAFALMLAKSQQTRPSQKMVNQPLLSPAANLSAPPPPPAPACC